MFCKYLKENIYLEYQCYCLFIYMHYKPSSYDVAQRALVYDLTVKIYTLTNYCQY